ncbi:MAG: hypothetical protein ABI554_08870 [Flavobacterium sp.]
MKNSLLLLLSIFFFSCQQKQNKDTEVKHSEPIVKKKNQEENKLIGDTLFMNFKDKKGFFVGNASLDSIHPRIYVKFKNEAIGELNATIITPTRTGNIRFNQIVFPDNTSNGPFGMDLKIKLTQKGNHILVIGHSLMADNPFWGKFKVQIENKKD